MTTLDDVSLKIADGSHNPPKKRESGVPMYSAQNIFNGYLDTSSFRYIEEKDFEMEKRRVDISPGDVLLTIVGTIGRTYVVKASDGKFALQRSVALIKPDKSKINADYLCYYLQANEAHKYLSSNSRGVAQKGVYLGLLRRMPISAPPIFKQEKIVAKIEELFSEIDNADAQLLSATRLENTYKQAIIDSTFDAIAENYKMTSLNDIAEIRGGVTKGRKLSAIDIVQIPYLRVANVQDGYLDLKEIKHIPGTTMDLEKYQLQYGDILFTEGGDKDKLGRGTIWRNEVEHCIHQNHIFRARVDLTKNDPEFISLAAQTTKSRHYFFSKAKQTTNLASINMTQLRQLKIPDVPISIQRDTLAQIKEMIEETVRTKRSIAFCTDYSQSLKQSILSRAFKGELV